ncbi:MAG TPA: flavodoxin domain-containing protein [Chitinophagaceae bacterium]|nr:flavodoxin domain-containing protein [Chitinophagaceae bacterium]
MLTAVKLKTFLDIVNDARRDELSWMNGYIAGLIAAAEGSSSQVSSVQGGDATLKKITIVYGTESGNSKRLAMEFAAKAKKKGVAVKLASLDQYRVTDLVKEEYFFTVISTQGDGEPPAAAKKFYDHIHLNGFKLDKLKYGVLALGDTSYPNFCKAGEDVDAQLQKLGGSRVVSLQKCDTDFDEEAEEWFVHVLQSVSAKETSSSLQPASAATVKKPSGKKIYKGTVLTNISLNDRGSEKQTHHIEIAAEDLRYEPGDAIGIVPADPSGKKALPRLYSVSSSLQQHEGEVHITVARNKFYANGELRYGLCSDLLSQLKEGEELEFYIHRNSLFKLPAPDRDVIMIGPGTGIAPFRAFLEERDASGATGRNWLFFGDQHFETDFLYQTEIQNWIETDVLTRVNVAFSRDQQEKVYVQHKMLQQAGELFEWLQGGAYLYVCGAKDPMSIDVENTLVKIFDDQGKDGIVYLNQLKEEGRYLKDVY